MDLTTNYFDLFELPIGYTVDSAQLASNYRKLQKELHPDRFVTSSEQERLYSMQMASRVNEGSRVLRNPIERARYMLELNGVDLGTGGETIRDTEFLMEQMELREELDEIGEDEERLDIFIEQMEQRVAEHGRGFEQQWQNLVDNNATINSENMKQEIQRMQFFSRLSHQAETVLDDLI